MFSRRLSVVWAVMSLSFVLCVMGMALPRQAQAVCASLSATNGLVTSTVTAPSSTIYRFWVRIYVPTTTDNAIYLQVDDTYCKITVGDSSSLPKGQFTWVDYRDGKTDSKINLDLGSGAHTIKLAGLDANVGVDKVLLLADTTCVPQGDGSNCIGTSASPTKPSATPNATNPQSPTATKTPNSTATSARTVVHGASFWSKFLHWFRQPWHIAGLVLILCALGILGWLLSRNFKVYDRIKRRFGFGGERPSPDSISEVIVGGGHGSNISPVQERIALASGAIIFIAGVIVLATHAAGLGTGFFAVDGQLSGNAVRVNNAAAIKGMMVRFATPSSASSPPSTTPSNPSSGSGSNPGSQSPPPSSNACPLPKYPTPSCTGVPSGTTFSRTINGDYTATAGQTIDGWHITGTLNVAGANVTIKNSQIDVGITNTDSGGQFAVTDTTVGPASGCLLNAGIGQSNYTASRVLIRNLSTGFQVSAPGAVIINDSYAKMCGLGPTEPDNSGAVAGNDGTHSSGIQACAASNNCQTISINHVTFDDRNDWHTTSVTIGLHGSMVTGFSLSNSLIIGGTYPLNIEWTSASPNPFVITNNAILNNSWDYAAASAENTCSHQTWSGNRIVTMDANYNVTGTVSALDCIE